ncbi:MULTISPECIES: ABC transporter permease [unclassified Mesorhizobium]|uniref:ABC transporter permease n=1 Tax=unclassified Mesorhizobium TaxID=325217 RepID=UPI000FCC2C1E|nr:MULTISPECIES: ABC transporter permease [unclassified Mesorhizobium]RUV11587.1 ABC transporter permease [Mesorhizobium sp. M1A.F.Ca.IN.022.04.1.1]RWG26259.1 MAG: ABC transporter permease [Mesorhizobium sp.]
MSALLAWLFTNPTVLAIGAAIIGALGFGFQQRLAGAKAERNRQEADQAEAASEAQKIDDAVAGRAPGANRTELSRWSKQ